MYTEYMYKDSLAHHGIKGQKWGVRRYQNSDGTLTAEGRARYGIKSGDSSTTKRMKRDLATLNSNDFKKKYKISNKDYMKSLDKGRTSSAAEIRRKKNIKKAVAIGVGVAAAGTAAVLGAKYLKNKKLLTRTVSDLTRASQSYAHGKDFVNSAYYNSLSKLEKNTFKKNPLKYKVASESMDALNSNKNPYRELKNRQEIRKAFNLDKPNPTKEAILASTKVKKDYDPSKYKFSDESILSKVAKAAEKSSKNTRKELADVLYNNKMNDYQRSKGLIELIKQTGMSGSELEEQGFIKMTGKEISDFVKYHPNLWKK